jgi:signal transduction histidine kinase
MVMPLLIAAVILLFVVTLALVRLRVGRQRQLAYIANKLHDILNEGGSGSLLLHTDDRNMRELLVAANRLLAASSGAKADYARAERSTKQMLANMSHDLKTPLTVVLGLTESIASDLSLGEEERIAMSAKAHERASDMLRLMNQFFDLARLESGDQAIPLANLNVSEVCTAQVLYYHDLIEREGLEAVIAVPESPVYALVNEEALGRVLRNLISNAIRYGRAGGVIGLSVAEDEQEARIEVWDRGAGIREQDQERVFERLYTLEDSRNPTYQGSGLGLTITKRLVELMGADIRLSSVPYERTVFTVRFKKLSARQESTST